MKERGLIFSGPMVRANLDGRKWQTRRVVTPQPDTSHWKAEYINKPKEWRKMIRLGLVHHGFDEDMWCLHDVDSPNGSVPYTGRKCPYGVPGDTFYMRETWWDLGHCEDGKWQGRIKSHVLGPRYVADCPDPYAKGIGGIVQPLKQKWQDSQVYGCTWRKRPSIHMPKWAARPERYEITDIRVEQLNSISQSDAKAEGVIIRNIGETYWRAFHTLWDSINSKRGYGWDVNPWCWCISYKKVKE